MQFNGKPFDFEEPVPYNDHLQIYEIFPSQIAIVIAILAVYDLIYEYLHLFN